MTELHPVMNNTKWRELRAAMDAIEVATTYRVMNINGYYSEADTEWFYHFEAGGYDATPPAAKQPNGQGFA
jgi:hypothetical protein